MYRKMMKYLKNTVVFLGIMAASGCNLPAPVPEIPEVTFKSFTLEEKMNDLGSNILVGTLKFRFQDGDGDIGIELPQGDSIPEGDTTYYNLFFTLHEKKDGMYRKISNDDLPSPLYYRIPYDDKIEPQGQNKTLSGEVAVEFEYLGIEYDTIMYSFFLIDRAGHRSNTDSTTDIGFTQWKDLL